MYKEKALELVKRVPNSWQEEIHDAVFGWDSDLMFEELSEDQAKKVLRYFATREEIQGEENDLRMEALVYLYDARLKQKICDLVDEISESYFYVSLPTLEDLEELEAPKWKEHVRGKLVDLLEYLRKGKFW